VVFVADNDPRQQLEHLVSELNLRAEVRLTRCSVCNTPTVPARAEEVEAAVPEHVRRTQRQFRRCPTCGRLYWPGSHVERMQARLRW